MRTVESLIQVFDQAALNVREIHRVDPEDGLSFAGRGCAFVSERRV